jgi:predicted CopG family antitoxin
MANVFLTAEAYARLKAAKNEGESFSDAVIRFIPQEIDWKTVLGSCRGINSGRLSMEIRRERER